jgi:hypothetical protein
MQVQRNSLFRFNEFFNDLCKKFVLGIFKMFVQLINLYRKGQTRLGFIRIFVHCIFVFAIPAYMLPLIFFIHILNFFCL